MDYLLVFMKVLIYGFGPYRQWKDNVTEKIIKRVKQRKNLKKVIYEISLNQNNFLDKIEKFKPDLIIGMGQNHRLKKINIERKAINLKRKNKKDKPVKILKNGPNHYFVNLKLKNDKYSRISYNAGRYICNFSMYTILNYAKNFTRCKTSPFRVKFCMLKMRG